MPPGEARTPRKADMIRTVEQQTGESVEQWVAVRCTVRETEFAHEPPVGRGQETPGADPLLERNHSVACDLYGFSGSPAVADSCPQPRKNR